MAFARFGTEIGHLPEQPLIDLDAPALVARIELAGLAPEILQDRARLEDRDRTSAGTVAIDDRGHAVVRRDFQEFGFELVAPRNVDRDNRVREPAHLKHDRYLPVELDRFRLSR